MKRSEIAISASLVPIDYLTVVLAGIASYFIRFWQPIQEIRPAVFALSFESYLALLWGIAFIWTIGFTLAGLYSMRGTRRPIDEVYKIILGSSTAVAILMFIFFFSRNLFDSRFIIIVGWIFSTVFVIIARGIIRFIQHYLYKYGLGVHRVVIIGKGKLAQEVAESFKSDVKAGFKVVGRFSDFSSLTEKEILQMIKSDKIDEVLVADSNILDEEVNQLNDFSYLNHITLKFVAGIFDTPITNFEFNTIASLPIIEVKKTKLDGWGKIYKRFFDILISSVFIIIASPILLVTALFIIVDSKGGIFFSYQRIGQLGRPFRYFKFRSMIKDAHQKRFDDDFVKEHENLRQGTPMIKFKNDPRITRVGKIIRRFSVDELPELFNVFIGKMSLVGPRPHEVEEVAEYNSHQKRVLTVKPGMTGMAQVSGRSDLDFDEEIRLDIWYMENWSPKLDFLILLKTPFAVLKRRKTE
ncbi:MAG: sugar transferase [Candidatus Buchananbacteria bacterium]|nr:sugar transferase [Candidatus Buchananbacteria bacterium]